MATITKHIVVCDVCRNIEAPTTTFRAAYGEGRLRTYALCEVHGNPVRELLGKMGSGAATNNPGRASKQVSMVDIEQVKATRPPVKVRGESPVPPTGFMQGS